MSAPEFVAIGHVTLDRFGGMVRLGGAALYAAITAQRLGLTAGLLTSHADDFPLEALPPQIEVVTVPASETTSFEHTEEEGTRRLRLRGRARPIGADDVPEDWGDAALVLLAPVIDEVDPLAITRFPDATIGAAVQGWVRRAEPDGRIVPAAWEPPELLLGRLQALFLSADDVAGAEDAAFEWFQHVPVGVMTAGRAGALLFVNGQRYELAVDPADEVDRTGAGDVFAATFLVHSDRNDDPWEAGRAASCAAGLSVTGAGWSRIPDRARLDRAVADWHRIESE
ncbi:MAG: sugar kinase [Candidatus Rokubacteria bacterium]|nr:sugar kinase [Candidatus Rokubacteria bacterium]